MPLRLSRYPVNWRKHARALKEAVDYRCQECNRRCYWPGTDSYDPRNETIRWDYILTVAHVYPDAHAPDAEVVCVQMLCAECHARFDAEHASARMYRWHRRHNMTMPAPWALSRESELDADDMRELEAAWPGHEYLLSLEDGVDHWAHLPVSGKD